jgi:hypothetical protein
VQVEHIDPVQPQPAQRLLDTAAHPGGGEVPDPAVRRRHDEVLVVETVRAGRIGLQEATDLGGHDKLVTGLPGQESSQPPLREPEAVMRRGVEITNPARPRGLQDPVGIGVGQCLAVIADAGRAVPEPAEGDVTHRRPTHGRPLLRFEG